MFFIAHLMNVYTNKNHQRQGIAKQMVNLLIDDAREKHSTEIRAGFIP